LKKPDLLSDVDDLDAHTLSLTPIGLEFECLPGSELADLVGRGHDHALLLGGQARLTACR